MHDTNTLTIFQYTNLQERINDLENKYNDVDKILLRIVNGQCILDDKFNKLDDQLTNLEGKVNSLIEKVKFLDEVTDKFDVDIQQLKNVDYRHKELPKNNNIINSKEQLINDMQELLDNNK